MRRGMSAMACLCLAVAACEAFAVGPSDGDRDAGGSSKSDTGGRDVRAQPADGSADGSQVPGGDDAGAAATLIEALPRLPACGEPIVLPEAWGTAFNGVGSTVDVVAPDSVTAHVSFPTQGATWWALASKRYDGEAKTLATRFVVRLVGATTAPQHAQVGCKLIFGVLGGNENVNARLAFAGPQAVLEVTSSQPRNTHRVSYAEIGNAQIGVAFDLTRLSPGRFELRGTVVRVGARPLDFVAQQVDYDGGPLNKGALFCGIMEGESNAGGSLDVRVENISAIVCP